MEKSSCRFEVLAHNADGYVVCCADCENKQLAFGMIVMTIAAEDFDDFYTCVYAVKKKTEANLLSTQKTIRLSVGAPHIRLALNAIEATQLLALLDEASATFAFNILMEEIEWK